VGADFGAWCPDEWNIFCSKPNVHILRRTVWPQLTLVTHILAFDDSKSRSFHEK
jgi:hypothetical protein